MLQLRTRSNRVIVYESSTISHLLLATVASNHDRLAIVFHRRPLSDTVSAVPKSKERPIDDHSHPSSSEETPSHHSRMTRFNSTCGYPGLFIGGTFPRWILLDQDHGSIFGHPMWCDGAINCFTTFLTNHQDSLSSPSSPALSGFAYVTHKVFK